MKTPMISLINDIQIPQVGLGTAGLKGSEGVQAMLDALELGYRYLDTAYNYENEGAVGRALHSSGLPRSEIQIASKLPGRYHSKEAARIAIEESLYRTGLDYFDIYLIHWPNPIQDQYLEAWEALLEAQNAGLIRQVGTSNFLPEHLARIVDATGAKPVLNQVELHPYFQQEPQRRYHEKQGILTQSWSPLGRYNTQFNVPVAELPIITELAEQHERSPAQIILRWHIQLGAMPIPKSSHKERLAENLALFDFELSDDAMDAIAKHNRPDGRNKNQDPSVYEEF